MIKAGIIGATGYAGGELVRLLLRHSEVELVWLGSRSYTGQRYADIYRNMTSLEDAVCRDDNMQELAEEADVIFTATPQGFCAGAVNEDILNKTKIIDLSADFRLKDVHVYEEWYKIHHASPQFLNEAVYGLCELNRKSISEARIVANPGCYTTCSILTLWPLVREGLIDPDTIIIDAKSGTSGAGRGEKLQNLFCEVNENVKAYGVATHRHTPEIEEQAKMIRNRYSGKHLCFAAGRHVPYKGMGYLVKAAKYLNADYEIVIAGQGPLTDQLKKEASSCPNIHFPGRISDEELKAYYLACDVFCFPSITKNEAFGLAMGEAMRFRKPCVTFHISGSGVNYVSLNQVTGLEVENGRADLYAEAIRTICENPELALRYGLAAEERAATVLSYAAFQENMKDLIRRLSHAGR